LTETDSPIHWKFCTVQWKRHLFSAREHICYSALYAIAHPSVRPSVTRVDQSKMLEL